MATRPSAGVALRAASIALSQAVAKRSFSAGPLLRSMISCRSLGRLANLSWFISMVSTV
ncbi:hypothetical protein D3C78_1996850 [compost metagenome]